MLSATALASPESLLSEAIKANTEISDNLTTKHRLDKYEVVFDKLNQITEKHSSSEISIQLLTNQNIGNFNPNSIRDNYITELSGYYNTVCETSPSFTCLGFVALNTGIKQCKTARRLSDVNTAHESILNAINVFIGQNDTSGYDNLALNAYRTCLDTSRFNASQWGIDHFASKLISPLLMKGKSDQAKAVIERMKTPYFKLDGILSLQEHSSKKASAKYVARLQKYIAEKLPEDSEDALLASIRLSHFAVTQTTMPIDYKFAREFLFSSRPWARYGPSCKDGSLPEYLYELVTDYQLALFTLDKTRAGYSKKQLRTVFTNIAGTDHIRTKFNGTQTKKIKHQGAGLGLDACSTSEGQNKYSLMTLLHGYLLLDAGVETAAEFKALTLQRSMSVDELYEYYFDVVVTSESIIEDNIDLEESFVVNLYKQPQATFPIFKKYVDFSNVCKSSSILFQQLKGSKRYNDAINYILNSKNIDSNQDYRCGNEELELLLN